MRLSVLLLCISTIPLTAAGPSPSTSDNQVRVTESEELGSAGALYHYRVTNPAQSYPIAALWVGYEYESSSFQLKSPPKGWSLDRALPTNSVHSPAGWHLEVMTQEEAEEMRLDWSVDNPRFELQPGQSATFSVRVEKRDPTYARSHWTVVFSTGHTGVAWGPLEVRPLPRGRAD